MESSTLRPAIWGLSSFVFLIPVRSSLRAFELSLLPQRVQLLHSPVGREQAGFQRACHELYSCVPLPALQSMLARRRSLSPAFCTPTNPPTGLPFLQLLHHQGLCTLPSGQMYALSICRGQLIISFCAFPLAFHLRSPCQRCPRSPHSPWQL